MLTAHHLCKSFDSRRLFDKVTFSINNGDRVGLIGPNGGGKTTLLRILAGVETPTEGHVSRAPDLRIGYLPQGFEPDPNESIEDIIGQAVGSAPALEADLVAVAAALAGKPHDTALQARYDRLVERISSAETGRAAQILSGLGLDAIDHSLPAGYLSGGQKTRLSLALVLLGDPQLLLLDEPTNHLDIHMLEWLENWLASAPFGCLIVSHDRTFLDHSVTRILELDPAREGVHEYTGNYSSYLEQRQAEIDKQWSAYKDQQLEIKQMNADIVRTREQAAYTERQASSIRIGGGEMKIKGMKSYHQGIAKKVAKKAKSRETRLEKYLDSDDRVEKPREAWQMKVEFNGVPHLGRTAIHMEDLDAGYDKLNPLLCNISLDVQSGQRIVLTGPNGSGKTTLLRTIAGQIPPLKGILQLGSSVRLGYMTQDQSSLNPEHTAVETLSTLISNETEARAFLAKFLLKGDEPVKPISFLSHGQRTRLMLAMLVAEGCNLLLLDEPVNHLDIPSRTQFEAALKTFEGAILAVVHDRYFIERFTEKIWWVENKGIKVEG